MSPSRSHHYVSEKGGENILKYQYSGSDASYYYKYLISPLAQRIVDNWYPAWLAPNTITTCGLALVSLSHLVTAYYMLNFTEAAPPLVYLFNAVALFVYQVLDVTDGKQARKTGNASPLGLLFDHGCDALTCVLSACNMAATMQMGPTYMSLGLLLSPATVFFMATWEEYYTGTLALPVINGPNEGLLIMYSIYAAAAIFGPGFWSQPSFIHNSIPNNLLFLLATGSASVVQCLENVQNVVKSLKASGKSVLPALFGLLPYLFLVSLSAFWIIFSPVSVLEHHPRLYMWTVGLLFAKLVMHMMLAHLCNEPIQLMRKTLVIIFSVSLLIMIGIIQLEERYIVVCYFSLAVIVYVHMVYYIIMELSTVLKIRVFNVKSKMDYSK